jgi:hypothetical protein
MLAEELNELVKQRRVLLHGSRVDIKESFLRSNGGVLFATDSGRVAILKAIVSNQGLVYPGINFMWNEIDNPDFRVRVYGAHSDTIGRRGFVYVVPPILRFEQRRGTREFLNNYNAIVQYSQKIPVSRSDIDFSIVDGDSGKSLLS